MEKVKNSIWTGLNIITVLLGVFFIINGSAHPQFLLYSQILLWIDLAGYLLIIFLDTTFVQKLIKK